MTVRLVVGLVLATAAAAPAGAQSPYASAGLGPTFVFDQPAGVNAVYRGIFGAVGLEWPGGPGARLEGTETYGFLWLSADLTYRMGAGGAPLQPYVLGGVGARMDLDDADPTGVAGAGVRAKLARLLSLFGEGRVHIASSQPRTSLLFAVGVSVAPR